MVIYPEFVPIYIGILIIIVLLVILFIMSIVIIRKINKNGPSIAVPVHYSAPSNGSKAGGVNSNNIPDVVVFCKKCAAQFGASEMYCPKCGTRR